MFLYIDYIWGILKKKKKTTHEQWLVLGKEIGRLGEEWILSFYL